MAPFSSSKHVKELEELRKWACDFGGECYYVWAFRTKLTLKCEELWEIVSGEEPQPADAEEAAAWQEKMKSATGHIVLSMNTKQCNISISQMDSDAKELWDYIADIYKPRGRSIHYSLRRMLYHVKMEEGDSLSEHVKLVSDIVSLLKLVGAPCKEQEAVEVLLYSLARPCTHYRIILMCSFEDGTTNFQGICAFLISEGKRIAEEKRRRKADELAADICYYCNSPGHWARNCKKKAVDLKKSEQVY